MLNRIAVVLSLSVIIAGCRVIEPEPPAQSPRIGSFTADKTRVAPGEAVTLSFTTTGATLVELTDDSGNSIQLEGAVTEGTARVAPARTAFYVLRATGAGGRDTAFVQIAVNEPLREVFLIPVPSRIDSGAEAQLLWGAPGASTVTLTTAGGTPAVLTGSTGSVAVTPATTQQYTLTAQGAPGTPPLTALAEIEVRPVLKTATLDAPTGVQPGETITFNWTAAGASSITISERSFGQLTVVTDAASVANGSFDFVLPAALPNAIAVSDGLPLRFTISASGGGADATRLLTAVVGGLPVIELFDAPEFATVGVPFHLSWKTLNATQITVSSGGLPLFQTIPGEQARVDQGELLLPGPAADTEYTLTASNELASITRVFNVRSVAPPVINTFTLTPTINTLGDPATARWTTQNATRVQLRFENGAGLAVVSTPSQVASGSLVLFPATSARITLEAWNEAGDLVSETRTVRHTGSAVTVTPTPAARGVTATLSWTLAPGGVLETVGLPTPAPAPIPNSVNFVDLSTNAQADELLLTDPASGSAKLAPPSGFRFPLLGAVQELYVSVDGFITFAPPAVPADNADFTASGNGAPAMLAPFWDDLTMTMDSKVLSALQVSPLGERYLVVQWEKFQIAGDGNSELTFQVHLYETGQVAFIYKTATGDLSSSTVGVNVPSLGLVQQYTFDSSTTVVAPDLELNHFSGGPADGTSTFTAARSERIEFFGRTATGLIPVSAEVRVFGPGDVSVTEVMPLPEASVTATGQWVELRNNASVAVDFDGLVVSSQGSTVDGGYAILPGTVVPAGGYLVLGQSTNVTETGGATVDQIVSDLPLNVPDEVKVSLQGVTLGGLSYDAGVAGTSVQASEAVLLPAGQTFSCTRTRTFGPAGALGTPGAANEQCAPYVVEPMPPGYVDISTTGTVILATASSYSGTGSFPLTTPFTFFGQSYSSINVAMVGFLSFGPALPDDNYVPNDTVPAASAPSGVIAPFWDEIVRNTAGELYLLQAPGRTIISWQDFRIYATTSAAYFQVHLLPGGVIEFHYGNMSGGTTAVDRLLGSSATAWLEKPDGSLAVPLSVNTLGGIQPNTSFRFTPAAP